MSDKVVVIGGGVAGLTAASALSEMGIEVILVEKDKQLGGHLKNWDRLFPNRRPAAEVLDFITKGIHEKASVHLQAEVNSVTRENGNFQVSLSNGNSISGKAVLLATGFQLFDAEKKEEYGYGIYDNVITSAGLESVFKSGAKLMTAAGNEPQRVGFVHCVGSRDEKVGNLYCSKVCCVTAVKQAIEVREQWPGCDVFCFYMDLRMFDRYFEEMYYEAQQKWGITFIRGRLSECSESTDGKVILKVEDTLSGLPLKISVNVLVLMTGFVPSPGSHNLAGMLGVPAGPDRFMEPLDGHIRANHTAAEGVFLTGTAKGPSGITATMADARAAATEIANYLQKK